MVRHAELLEVAGDQLDHPSLVVDHHHMHPVSVGAPPVNRLHAAVTFRSYRVRSPFTRFTPVRLEGPAPMTVPTELLGALGRLGLDVLAMLLLVGWLYRRRLAAPEMALVFTALNIGLFAAVTPSAPATSPPASASGSSACSAWSGCAARRSPSRTSPTPSWRWCWRWSTGCRTATWCWSCSSTCCCWWRSGWSTRPGARPRTRLMRVTLDTAVTDLEAAAAEVRRRSRSSRSASWSRTSTWSARHHAGAPSRYAVPEAPDVPTDGGRELDDDAQREALVPADPPFDLSLLRRGAARGGARGGAAADPRRPQVPPRLGTAAALSPRCRRATAC